MAVRWPDGSYTGSAQVKDPVPPPVEPEPEELEDTEPVIPDNKKEASDGTR